MRRVITTLLIAFVCVGLADVWAQKTPVVSRVYVFGFAASFTDSIACQTEIQQLDSAWIEPSHEFLIDRSLYGLQLQNHMSSVEGCRNAICSIFFNKNPRKLQRTWKKVKKRYEKAEGLRFSVIPAQRFSFTAEEYHEVTIGDVETEAPSTTATPEKKGKKSKKDKKDK